MYVAGIKALLVIMCSLLLPRQAQEKISGKWKMVSVSEYGKDVTEKHNPSRNRFIRFNTDGTFVSDGDPFGQNTGRWSFDHQTGVLVIDSDMDDDDSSWNVSFGSDGSMQWTGIGHTRKENTRIVHQKSE